MIVILHQGGGGRLHSSPALSKYMNISFQILSTYLSGITSSLKTFCNLLDLLRKYKIVNIKIINAVIQLTELPTITFIAFCFLLSLIPVSVSKLTIPVGVESKINKFRLLHKK